MHRVCILLLLHATFAIGRPSRNHKLHPLLHPELAETEQTVLIDLVRGLATEILDQFDIGPLKSIYKRVNDFLQNEWDPEGAQAAHLKTIISITEELLGYLRSVVPDELVKDQQWFKKKFNVHY